MKEKNILIVDDEQEILEAIVNKLIRTANRKYAPLVAKDGYEAIDLLKKYAVSAVVLDLNMRNMDGMRVCFEMRNSVDIGQVPIIISSGYINNENREKLFSLGVRNFLEKPYEINDLLDVLESVLI